MPPVLASGERQRRHHNRSRNGCITCKQRHKRCDEGKPICLNCMVIGGICGYPNTAISHCRRTNSETPDRVLEPNHPSTLLNATSADPFDTLPITLDSNSQFLLDHYRKYRMFVKGFVDRRPNDGMFALATSDAALLHASLIVSASHWTMIGGQNSITESMIYYHKVEALRIVNERMSDPTIAVKDSTMAAIASMTILETAIGSPHVASLHMSGLYKILELRRAIGGQALGWPLPKIIQTLIQLADISTASVTHKQPRFQSRMMSDPHSISSAISASSTWTDHDGLGEELSTLMADLHRLTDLWSATDCGSEKEVSTWIEACHIERCIESLVRKYQTVEEIFPLKRTATLLACQVYFYKNFRTLNTDEAALHLIVAQLRKELELSGAAELEQCRPELLFWIAFIAASATNGMPECVWFLNRLRILRKTLSLHTWEQAKETLGKFAWPQGPSEIEDMELWHETREFRA